MRPRRACFGLTIHEPLRFLTYILTPYELREMYGPGFIGSDKLSLGKICERPRLID